MNLITCPLKELLVERHEIISQEEFLANSYQRLLKIDFNGEIHYASGEGKSPLRTIHPGDLVLSRINAGRGAISLNKYSGKLASTKHYAIFSIQKGKIIPELLLYLLRNKEMLARFRMQLKPGIKSELSNRTFLQYEVSFPQSLEDQSKLLSRIEKRMQQLKNIKNRIFLMKKLIDFSRRKLLHEYFKENSWIHLKYEHEKSYPPSAWEYKKLKDIASLRVGKTPPQRNFTANGIPFLKVQNIVNQAIPNDTPIYHITLDCYRNQFKNFPSRSGDILMNIVGPPLGKIAMFPDHLAEAGYNQGLVNIRPKDSDLSTWIFWYLNEMTAIRNLPRTGIAGQENLSVKQIRNIAVPIPETEQRAKILKHLERNLKVLENMQLSSSNMASMIEVLNSKIISCTLSLSNKNG